MIRILLVDDQKSIRERLKSLLETEPDFDIVGMVDNGYDAIEQVKLLLPDVVLMDMEMPDIDGILATKIIAHSSLKTKVLVLSSYDSDEYVARSIYSGANGYILKGAPAEEIRDAIRFVNRGYMQIAPGLFEKFIPHPNAAYRSVDLADRSFKPMPHRGNFPPEMELTGLNLVKSPENSVLTAHPDFDQPSELVVDISAQTSQKSVGWYQAVALAIAGLGLTSSLYFLRQGLHKPTTTPNQSEQSNRLHELPFTGKIEPIQPIVINATTPGFVTEIHAKLGQKVNPGDRLLTIRNVEAERANQAKIEQQQQQAIQQQQAAIQQANQQQQQVIQQQQILLGEQQAAALRVSSSQLAIANYQRNLAPLQQQVAYANVRSAIADRPSPSPLRQKRAAIARAQAIYDRSLATYQRLAQYQSEGAIARERVEQAEKEMTVAKSDLDIVQEDYHNAIATAEAITAQQSAQAQSVKLQQQLTLKEQAGQLQQLQAQLRVAQSDYQQISNRLQQLQQQKSLPIPNISATPTAVLEPTKIDITAPITGTVVELPISQGTQVFTGNKLFGLANLHKLKIGLDLATEQATLLKSSQRAIVKVGSGIESQELMGLISQISPTTASAGNLVTQRIEVEFTNPQPTSLIGQLGTVYFPK
jgi:hemolysin D